MPEYVTVQAQKALFALNGDTKSSLGYIPPKLALKMFDTYILPILEYNSELWLRTTPSSELENLHLKYLRIMLGVRTQTPTYAVYAETGRYPLYVRQRLFSIKYWSRLESLQSTDILSKCLMIQKELHRKKQNNWYSKICHIMSNYNITINENMTSDQRVASAKLAMYMAEQDKILSGINDSSLYPKLRTYKEFKTDFRLEPYLTQNTNKKIYTKIARFRCSSHSLKIETGRHERPVIPAESRICEKCTSNEVEDELHCLITCQSHNSQRSNLFQAVVSILPNFNNLNQKDKFVTIMRSRDPIILKALGNFLNQVI